MYINRIPMKKVARFEIHGLTSSSRDLYLQRSSFSKMKTSTWSPFRKIGKFSFTLKPPGWTKWSKWHHCNHAIAVFACKRIWKTPKIHWSKIKIFFDVLHDENQNRCYRQKEKSKDGFFKLVQPKYEMVVSFENRTKEIERKGEHRFSKKEVRRSWKMLHRSHSIEYGIETTLDQ